MVQHVWKVWSQVMNLQRQVAFWLGALVVLILSLWLLRSILLPFVAGLALAYFLNPVVDRLERIGIGRVWGTLLVIGAFILVFIAAIVLVVPVLITQLGTFSAKLPGYVQKLQTLATDQNREWLQKIFGAEGLPDVSKSTGELVSQSLTFLGGFAQSLLSGSAAFISLFSLLVITPVVAFYLLADWKLMVQTLDSWLPRGHADTVRDLARQMDEALSGFVRGQATVCLVLAIYYGIGLGLSGLNFGVLIGILTGVLSFIPYVGSLTGLLLSGGIAVVQFWPEWPHVVTVLVIFGVGQFLEGNFLSPKLVGRSVGLHPVWLMFALLAFGSLFGFVGLLLAVPLAAMIGVLTRFLIARYLRSVLYRGDAEAPAP
jgi:predicted PurR-regulated permease PerM